MIDKYQFEDLMLEALRKQPLHLRISSSDVGRWHVDGVLDVSALVDFLWDRLPLKSAIPPKS